MTLCGEIEKEERVETNRGCHPGLVASPGRKKNHGAVTCMASLPRLASAVRQVTFGVMWRTIVRQATADDLELLEAIENEADALFATVFSTVGSRPAPSDAQPPQRSGFILVANDNLGSDPIGFAHVLKMLGSSHLEQLSVRPSAAHRGHWRALVEAVKSESRLRGCKRVTLRMFADVPWNAPFNLSCDYTEHGPDPDFLRDLLAAEQQRGLGCGRRIQINFDLADELPR
ncbi:hypothetical protein SAMN06296378_1847 [Salinibacterium xinjiangense]|uniref:N-acetyltransferase domain-containing protein n=1 Tax=Salinibacterium xinjiangense TaxID=386302 RepID=A0A2C8ZT58_9MICO|nr:hypothetical protein SAMN06296378_1847 [Salinibacterium xinjiangense]